MFRYEEVDDKQQQQQQSAAPEQEDDISEITSDSREAIRSFTHKCEWCATGVCRSWYLPKSETHEVTERDTVSTSASVIMNSSIDKAEYQDRDANFEDFINDDDHWNTVVDPL